MNNSYVILHNHVEIIQEVIQGHKGVMSQEKRNVLHQFIKQNLMITFKVCYKWKKEPWRSPVEFLMW